MKTKIKLKEGYGQGFMPLGASYKNYTMLVAIANYSKNGVCVSNAKAMLDEDTSIEKYHSKIRLLEGLGGFMRAVCIEDFALAWNRADGSNRDALLEALKNNEIEL
tara:strand:+ start:2736 stop:3053 length:318 start_codon:yes stop_codon:yes gene_type:complete